MEPVEYMFSLVVHNKLQIPEIISAIGEKGYLLVRLETLPVQKTIEKKSATDHDFSVCVRASC
ncbi:MAG: hypothetical protein ACJAYC_002837 [Halieaceae bacterium]|jgi:hypothetical protein